VDEFGWQFIEMGSLSGTLSPWSLMEDLFNELLVVLEAAVALMLHNKSASFRETRSKATLFSKLSRLCLTI
jgi:hypothetical protein